MIMDEYGEFADATALSTGEVGTTNVGDVVDLGSVSRDIGNGQDLSCVIKVDTTVTSTDNATVVFQLVSSSDATPNTTGAQTVHFATSAIPKATLVAGYQIANFVLPQGTYKRYLGVQATTAVSVLSAGAVSAFLTPDKSGWKAYADNVN